MHLDITKHLVWLFWYQGSSNFDSSCFIFFIMFYEFQPWETLKKWAGAGPSGPFRWHLAPGRFSWSTLKEPPAPKKAGGSSEDHREHWCVLRREWMGWCLKGIPPSTYLRIIKYYSGITWVKKKNPRTHWDIWEFGIMSIKMIPV